MQWAFTGRGGDGTGCGGPILCHSFSGGCVGGNGTVGSAGVLSDAFLAGDGGAVPSGLLLWPLSPWGSPGAERHFVSAGGKPGGAAGQCAANFAGSCGFPECSRDLDGGKAAGAEGALVHGAGLSFGLFRCGQAPAAAGKVESMDDEPLGKPDSKGCAGIPVRFAAAI